MRLHRLLVATALLVALVVLAFGAFAWREAEERVLGAAEAEGRALLRTVAAGVRRSLDAGREVDGLLAARLFDLADRLEEELATSRVPVDEVLATFVAAHELRGAVALDQSGQVVGAVERRAAAAPSPGGGAAAKGPFAPGRLARLEAEALARRARASGLDRQDRVSFGFGENPLGARTEFLVGTRAQRAAGFLLLRQDAGSLAGYQEAVGVQRYLEEAAQGPGVTYLLLEATDGTVLAAGGAVDVLPPAGQLPGWRQTGRGRVLDVTLPAPWPGPPEGSLRVGLALEPVEAAVLGRARRNLLVLTCLALLTGTGGFLLLAHRERRTHARETTLRAALEERERFAALGRLAGGVAHEVRSPLNALSMAAQRLRREVGGDRPPDPDRLLPLLDAVAAAVERLDGTVEEFLALGRPPTPVECLPFDLTAAARRAVDAEDPGAAMDTPESGVTAQGDGVLTERALANLIRNGRQVAPGTVRVSVTWTHDGTRATVCVDDRGPGIPPAERALVFEPFHTGREGGTGLGLAIAREAVERQGGEIRVLDAPGGGTRFAVHLPAVPDGAGGGRS